MTTSGLQLNDRTGVAPKFCLARPSPDAFLRPDQPACYTGLEVTTAFKMGPSAASDFDGQKLRIDMNGTSFLLGDNLYVEASILDSAGNNLYTQGFDLMKNAQMKYVPVSPQWVTNFIRANPGMNRYVTIATEPLSVTPFEGQNALRAEIMYENQSYGEALKTVSVYNLCTENHRGGDHEICNPGF